jgi:hemerythrin
MNRSWSEKYPLTKKDKLDKKHNFFITISPDISKKLENTGEKPHTRELMDT